MINQMRKDSFERAKKIKLIIMDVDGTLTDGGIYIGESGELFKSFHCRDGIGIDLARRAGMEIALLTGRTSKQLLIRAQELKINPEVIFQGQIDKRDAYKQIKNKFHVTDEEVAYFGDDIVDLPIMMQVGFTGTVSNAVVEVKNRSCVVSDFNGGQGAVREIIEFILKAKNLWNDILTQYLSVELPKVEVKKDPFYMIANKSNQSNQSVQPIQKQNSIQNQSAKIISNQSIPSTKISQSAQNPKDENLEKLERIGKKLNTKF